VLHPAPAENWRKTGGLLTRRPGFMQTRLVRRQSKKGSTCRDNVRRLRSERSDHRTALLNQDYDEREGYGT
jgi:hypothetical protein